MSDSSRHPFWYGLIGGFIAIIFAAWFFAMEIVPLILIGDLGAVEAPHIGEYLPVILAVFVSIAGIAGSVLSNKRIGGALMAVSGIILILAFGLNITIPAGLLLLYGGYLRLSDQQCRIAALFSARKEAGKSPIILIAGGIGAVILFGIVMMAVFQICPPPGPWPTPPWCEDPDFAYIMSGDGDTFFKGPVFLLSSTPYEIDGEVLDDLQPHGIAWSPVILESFYRVGHMNMMAMLRERNIHFIGAGRDENLPTSPHPTKREDMAAVDIHGNPIVWFDPHNPGYLEGYYYRNILNPLWQEEIRADLKEYVDAGVQGVVVDHPQSGYIVIFREGGSFDEYSMAGFNTYLKDKYTAEELKSRYAIPDIDTFHLGDYLLENNMEHLLTESPYNPHPLIYEFGRFQKIAGMEFWRETVNEMKAYSRDRYGREFFFSMNAGPAFADRFLPMDFVDYLSGEFFYFNTVFNSPQKVGIEQKLTEGHSKHFSPYIEVSYDRGRIPRDTENLFKYLFADAYSSRTNMLIRGPEGILTMDGRTYVDFRDYVRYDGKAAGRYTRYLHEHPELFHADEPARVAVIHSFASRKGQYLPLELSGISNYDLIGTMDLLFDLYVPYSMIISGCDVVPRDITASDLVNYEVVILPSATILNEGEIDVLLEYVRNGGVVIQTGKFGLYNKEFETNTHNRLEELRRTGAKQIGAGTWHTVAEVPGYAYYLHDGEIRLPSEKTDADPHLNRFRDILYTYYDPEIRTDAPITVGIRRYATDESVLLHLVNYNYNHRTDAFTTTPGFEVVVEMPPGRNPERVILYNLETGVTGEIPFASTGNSIVIPIERLEVYSIVEIR
ncbi:DUF4064 domain-containing protein [Methanocalculus sp. MC3]